MSSTDTDWSERVGRLCRTHLGDPLRAVVVFTPSDHEVVYLRDVLDGGTAGRSPRREYVDIERGGFADQNWFDRLSAERGTGPELGGYVSTIRLFTDGVVARVVSGDLGVMTTAADIDLDTFEVLAADLRQLLAATQRAGRSVP